MMLQKFEDLKGCTIASIEGAERLSEQIIITLDNGEKYQMFHYQSCCENVSVEDIIGDIDDLIGTPILMAEEAESGENPEGVEVEYQDSFTWTFYKLATIKGYVTIRWYGESNGWYSESVDFELVRQ